MIKSFKERINQIVEVVLKDHALHGLWINTLSYLENCGARKIASCENPKAVKEEMLKHAAEEFRHAFYLKKQLSRINQYHKDYHLQSLLGGYAAYHYLNTLDIRATRYLKTLNLIPEEIKQYAYFFITYVIELRAEELYPIYQFALKKHRSKIQVQSILEEKEHLQEMQAELSKIKNATTIVKHICVIEADLFEKWLKVCELQTKCVSD